MLLEAMGLHVPGAAFIHPKDDARDVLTGEAVRILINNIKDKKSYALGEMVDEKVIINAMAALLATGGSTNHLIHWVAIARAAGIIIDWTDFHYLAKDVPLLASVYPNGIADVNQFQDAGGPSFVIRELLDNGCMFDDVLTVCGQGMEKYGQKLSVIEKKISWSKFPKN